MRRKLCWGDLDNFYELLVKSWLIIFHSQTKINKKDCIWNICSQHWGVNDSNILVLNNLIKISRNFKLIFIIINGFQIRIPRPKICMCWKFQVHTAKRTPLWLKHVHGQKLLKLFFFLKKLFLFFSIRYNSSGLSVSLEKAWWYPWFMVILLLRLFSCLYFNKKLNSWLM